MDVKQSTSAHSDYAQVMHEWMNETALILSAIKNQLRAGLV